MTTLLWSVLGLVIWLTTGTLLAGILISLNWMWGSLEGSHHHEFSVTEAAGQITGHQYHDHYRDHTATIQHVIEDHGGWGVMMGWPILIPFLGAYGLAKLFMWFFGLWIKSPVLLVRRFTR